MMLFITSNFSTCSLYFCLYNFGVCTAYDKVEINKLIIIKKYREKNGLKIVVYSYSEYYLLIRRNEPLI